MVDRYLRAHDWRCQHLVRPHQMPVRAPLGSRDPVE